MVDGDRACAKKDEGEGDGGQREWEFESVIAGEAVVPVHFPNGDAKIDADGEGGGAGEESGKDEQSAEKFRERREIPGPGRKAQAGHEMSMIMQSAKDLV